LIRFNKFAVARKSEKEGYEPKPSLRAKAKQSIAPQNGLLRRGAPRNDVVSLAYPE